MKKYLICLLGLILAVALSPPLVLADEFKSLAPAELKTMQPNKDFFLLDVHIPEQTHIPGTDAFIDFREIRQSVDQLPAAKHTKIVVYCRSGGMSRIAASNLVAMGYTHVYDLVGGSLAYNQLTSP